MPYKPGDIFYKEFTTYNISGISTNTDSTPWGQLSKNGTDDFSTKTFVTNIDTGRYVASGTIPNTYAYGSSIQVTISGQISALLSKSIIDLGVLDSQINTLTTIGVTGTVQANVVSANQGVTVSTTGTVQANVISFSGSPVSAANNGLVLGDIRDIAGIATSLYNGIAQTGTTNTITLASNEPAIDQYYQWLYINTVGGTGPNQFGLITAYSGSTKIAYMDRNWATIPDSSTQYSFIGYGMTNTEYMQNQALSSKFGLNINTFFQNAGNTTTQIVDNVTSGTGGSDWTATERSQIRYKLGIDGTAVIPVSGLGHLELSSSGLRSMFVEPGVNVQQFFTEAAAVLLGISSGANNMIWYQGMNNSVQNRVSSLATSGIRTTVNYVLP